MRSHLSIYFPNSVHTGTEHVMRGIVAGAHAEAVACKCPYYIHRVQDVAEVPGSRGLMGMFGAARKKGRFLRLGIPVVNVSNATGPVEGMANVLSDDIEVGRVAARHLLDKRVPALSRGGPDRRELEPGTDAGLSGSRASPGMRRASRGLGPVRFS